ncbi:MAG: hypothetical protein HS116_15940 [Planctomycetes bacterium]|nr:hypothetical protein [Planctomycetota bacterium]
MARLGSQVLLLSALLWAPAVVLADTVVLKNGQELEGEILKQDDDGIRLKVPQGMVYVERTKILAIEEDTPEKIAARERAAEEKRKFDEAMRAKGLVNFGGKWMRPEDQAKILADRAAADAKKKADEAKRKADEEKKAAEAAKKAAQKPAGSQQSALDSYLEQRRTGRDYDNKNDRNTNDRFDRNRNDRNDRNSRNGNNLQELQNRLRNSKIDRSKINKMIEQYNDR